MSHFFTLITSKWYAPNLTYIMKKHEKGAQKSAYPGGSNVRSWDAAYNIIYSRRREFEETRRFTEREEDEGTGQDQDGVHRQQAPAVHNLLKTENWDHEEGVRTLHTNRFQPVQY